MSSPRRPSSAAPVPPLDDDNLLSEILLRLPPVPSSLPRASFVCKRWLRLISDPRFFRRFRAHHRRNTPLLGWFCRDFLGISFLPSLETPNCVPHGRFSLRFDAADARFILLGCRHGLALIFQAAWHQLLVWDPINGDQHRLALPPPFDVMGINLINGAVLRASGEAHFQVVLVGTDKQVQHTRALACVYSSETGVWGDLISTPLPSVRTETDMFDPGVLAGDSLYWLLRFSSSILEFNLDRQSLAVMRVPVDMHAERNQRFRVMRAEGGGLGFLLLSHCSAQLWKRKYDSDGVALWVMDRAIELDMLLSLNPGRSSPILLGSAEDNTVVLLWTAKGFFMVHLDSLHLRKMAKSEVLDHVVHCHPFESVYTGTSIGGAHGGAELLQTT